MAPARATDHFNRDSGIATTIDDIEPIERGSAEFQTRPGWIGAVGVGVGVNRGPETPVVTLTLGLQVGM